MKSIPLLVKALSWRALAMMACPALAADYPAPKEGIWVVRDFRFHTGEFLPGMKRVKHGRGLLIPGSDQSFDHGTTGRAGFWKQQLGEVLQTAPRSAQ